MRLQLGILRYMGKIWGRFSPNAQDLHKMVVISPMRIICARLYLFPQCARLYLFLQCAMYVQDCTSFPNAQYMHKICTRLYLFLHCAIYPQDLCKIVLISQCAIYAQHLRKIVLLSPIHNICTRLYLISYLKC